MDQAPSTGPWLKQGGRWPEAVHQEVQQAAGLGLVLGPGATVKMPMSEAAMSSAETVFGGALSRAVADFVVIDPAGKIAANEAHHTPDGVDDRTAATLTVAGRTASAALAVIDPGPGDTVLIGGAGAGSGCSPSSWPGWREPA